MKPPTHLPPHVQRVYAEGGQLAEKLDKLAAFKHTETFKKLAVLDAHLLTLQEEVMRSYLHILTIRLARANDAHNGVMPNTATALGGSPIIKAN